MKMKTLAIVAVTGALASPALTLAQQSSDQSVTRAQVRDDLVQMEQAGYDPSRADNAHYPTNVQAAESRVAVQDDAQLTNNAMGGVAAGSSASGGPATGTYRTTPYYPSSYQPYSSGGLYGASGSGCGGPKTFCDIYSGGK